MDGAVSSVADVVRGMLPWSSTPKTRPSRTLSRTPNFNFKDHLLRPDSVETLVLSPSRLPPDDTEDLNPLEDESTTQQKSLLSRCLGGWFITAAVASTLVSIPVTLACLPFALAALAPAALFLLGSLLALRITFILFGREGLVWAGFRFVLNTGIDVVRYTATVLLQKLSGQQPMPTIDVSSSSGSTLMDHHAEGKLF